jgi:hypothetical protein
MAKESKELLLEIRRRIPGRRIHEHQTGMNAAAGTGQARRVVRPNDMSAPRRIAPPWRGDRRT